MTWLDRRVDTSGRGDRASGPALAVAGDAQRRVRGGRPRLVVRRVRRGRPAVPPRRSRRCTCSASAGIAVTMPHKERCRGQRSTRSTSPPRICARSTRSCLREDGSTFGASTDGQRFRQLAGRRRRRRSPTAGSWCSAPGSGAVDRRGAGRAGAADIAIVNRTQANAAEAAAALADVARVGTARRPRRRRRAGQHAPRSAWEPMSSRSIRACSVRTSQWPTSCTTRWRRRCWPQRRSLRARRRRRARHARPPSGAAAGLWTGETPDPAVLRVGRRVANSPALTPFPPTGGHRPSPVTSLRASFPDRR